MDGTLKYKNYEIEDFVEDSRFISWVSNPSDDENLFWEQLVADFPDQQKKMAIAREYIHLLGVEEAEMPKLRKDQVWEQIRKSSFGKTSFLKLNMTMLKYAAILVMLIGGAGSYLFFTPKTDDYDYLFDAGSAQSQRIKIILPDGMEKDVDKAEANVVQSSSGVLVVNNDTLRGSSPIQEKKEQKLAHIIVPFGKQGKVELSDGTQVILNAGSRLSFPEHFESDKREIYLTGEAFFQVASDKNHPFIVHTSAMDIVATGTKFNVNSYPENQEFYAALVEGVVSVNGKGFMAKRISLNPGEAAFYNMATETISVREVSEELYVSWIHGYLICEKEPISSLFEKLGRYYNQPIVCSQDVEGYRFSGKLNLRGDLDEVLNIISIATGITVTRKQED